MWKKCLLLLFLLGASSHSYALIRSDVQTAVRRNVRDTATDTSLQRYSEAVLVDYIEEVEREVVNLTRPLHATTTYNLIAQTTYYNLPADFLGVRYASYKKGNSTYELKAQSEISYRKNNPDYERQAGPPSDYFVRTNEKSQSVATSPIPSRIAFIPVQPTSTGTVSVDYYYSAPDFTSETEVLFNGQSDIVPFHDIVIYGVTFKILLIEGKLQEAAAYQQLYNDKLSIMMRRFQSNPDYAPSIIAGPTK